MREESRHFVRSLLIWLGLAYLTNAQSQSCSSITINDLGNTTSFSSDGLVAVGLLPPGESVVSIPVRIMNYTIVCDTSGNRRDTSSYVSVVVQFQCNYSSTNPTLTVCDGRSMVTRQYQFQCTNRNGQPVWDVSVSGDTFFVQTLNPTATLSTPLANQCRRCIDDQQSSSTNINDTTHCDSCGSGCNQGQGRCFIGSGGDVCCNFYLQGGCVAECPSALVADSNFDCVCPLLSLANGSVTYSPTDTDIGSVAIHTCNSGYRLMGGETRICTSSNGWDGQDITCGEVVSIAINCPAENVLTESGISYFWPITFGGQTAILTCPLNSNVLVTRNCNSEGSWQTITDNGCTINEQLGRINNSFANLTSQTYGNAVAMLSNVIEATENNSDIQTNEVLSEVATYFRELADFVNESNVIINTTIIMDIVRVVNSFLQWAPENIMVASTSSMVESFESIISTYAQQLSLNKTQKFISLSLTVVAVLESVDSLAQRGRSFLIGDNDLMLGPEDQVQSGQLSPQLDASISLPASLFEQIVDRDNVGVFFALHEVSILFPVHGDVSDTLISSPRKTSVGSHILAATVGPAINFQNLDEPVTVLLRLQITKGNFIAQGTETCVSWDFSLQDWITDGCTTTIGEDGVITCTCNHLTNFAVLVDICLRQEDCEHSRVDQELTYISYIGVSVSIVCLIFTILTLLIFKEIREKDIAKYHIQLCCALLCMFTLTLILVGLSAEKVTTIYGGCVSLSLLVHYFTLVAVMWMGAEALLMFQKLVIVFVRITAKSILVISIICWVVPIVVVLIPFIVDMANGQDIMSDIIIQRAKMKDDLLYCFLSHIGALIGAFLAPILVIIVINTVIFIWVVVVVSRHTREKAARTNTAVNNKQILRMTISISGVLFLFGLTWLFFILTFSVPGLRETFQILFTIFNSLQGFFVFAFILFTEGFDHWKAAFFSCHKSKPTQPSLGTSISSKEKSTDLSTRLSNSTSETPHNVSTIDHEMSTTLKELEALQPSTDMASPTKLNNQDAIGNDSQKEGGELKKQTNTNIKPLKVLVKRYSTKKYRRHQVEEVKVHFYHDGSSSSDEDGGAASSVEFWS